MDVRRFGAQYRSPSYTLARTLETYETYYDIVYPGHEREAGRPLRTIAGLRRGTSSTARRSARSPAGSGSTTTSRNARPATSRCGRAGGPAGTGRRRSASSTPATREAAALFDESSFAKLRGHRPGRRRAAGVGVRQPGRAGVGDITYTQALNARGGIESDFTVTRLADDAFLVVTGTAFGTHDGAWLRRQARRRDADGARRRRHRRAGHATRCGVRAAATCCAG